jgi:aldehyde dehydrogenase (NAD+)
MLSTTTSAVRTFSNYIGGQWLPTRSDRVYERCNPARRSDVVGRVPLSSPEDVDEAVRSAERAFAVWRTVTAPERAVIVGEAARVLRERSGSVAAAITREQGKTLAESHSEVAMAAKVLEYMAGEGRRLCGETLPSERGGTLVFTVPQPVGIVGLITPWNFPLAVSIWKIAPALVCGNAIVWKPSRLTPLTSEAVAEVFADAGLPSGVLNLVNGSGSTAGAAVVEHPRIRAISFTSSFEVGTDIYSRAARLFKKVQCEAGGKNAAVVLADANIEHAAQCIISGAFKYAGQRCTATSRVIVVDDIADPLVDVLVDRTNAIIVGDGMDPQTQMGPISDETQMSRLLRGIRGIGNGLVRTGGHELSGSAYDDGLFLAPTIIDHVCPTAEIACEEMFGPILAVVRVPHTAAALEAVNATRYGMVTSLFTEQTSTMMRAIDDMQCGIIHVNGATIEAEVHVPFGGIKDTGVGDRELGSAAVKFYTEQKVVYLNRSIAGDLK